jgi:hypothetical protein
LDISLRSVQRSLKSLTDKNIIERTRRKRFGYPLKPNNKNDIIRLIIILGGACEKGKY